MNAAGFFKEFGILLSLLLDSIVNLKYKAMELMLCSLCSNLDMPIAFKSRFEKLAKLPLNQLKGWQSNLFFVIDS